MTDQEHVDDVNLALHELRNAVGRAKQSGLVVKHRDAYVTRSFLSGIEILRHITPTKIRKEMLK